VILVDTSIWADHLNTGDLQLSGLLNDGTVMMHPFIFGELALGNLRQRASMLSSLGNLPMASPASDHEVMAFIEISRLYGTGVGWVDAHLITSAKIESASLWTRDKKLAGVATKLGLGFDGG
jgi:predicted nucleic acid-binding protein